ncbi:expression site-associated protein 5 (ESAG5) [Novymonas esmeraldas]|uniref:Expression site-associated protein 5 (ESAG5) n=1 Tax=Novymonas esmeraldas TaxID=1808958 RepID=A0AAW0EQA7_9TRYP
MLRRQRRALFWCVISICYLTWLGYRLWPERRQSPPRYERDAGPRCLPANVSVAVSATVVNAAIQAVAIPWIQDDNNVLVVPEQQLDHVWVDTMVLQHFRLESLIVNTGLPDAQSMTLHAARFGLEVKKSRFVFQYLGIKCYGNFWATLNETNATAVLGLTLVPEGHWNATVSQLMVHWGVLDIHHELDSKACGIAQRIVEVFTGELDTFIAAKVKSKLDEDAPAKIAEGMNNKFASSSFRVITPPVMTEERVAVTIDANPVSFGCEVAAAAQTVPEFVPRDVAVHTSAASVNNFLLNAVQAQALQVQERLPSYMNTSLFINVVPELYHACPDCPLYTLVQLANAPVVETPERGRVSVSVENVLVGLYVEANSRKSAAALAAHLWAKSATAISFFYDDVNRSFVTQWHRGIYRDMNTFPVLALLVEARSGIRNLDTVGGRAISYEVLPVQVAMSVMASNVGRIDTDELAYAVETVWNDVGVPLVNLASPLRLPFFLRKAALDVGPMDIDSGFNVGIKDVLSFMKSVGFM